MKKFARQTIALVLSVIMVIGMLTVGASAAAPEDGYSTEIVWDDMFGPQAGTLTIDPDAETWTVVFGNDFGSYTIGGWYITDTWVVEITEDAGMSGFLPSDEIKAAVAEGLQKIYEENGISGAQTFTADVTFQDMFGPQPGTLTVNADAEQWTLVYENDFGTYEIGGWYVPDTWEAEITNDAGMGGFLPGDEIKSVIAEAIKAIYAENDIVRPGEGAHAHRWSNGVCAVCGEVCKHPSWTDGVCDVCRYACQHPEHDKNTLICKICGERGYHTFVDGACINCGATTIFEMDGVPAKYLGTSSQPGTIVDFNYSTYKYNGSEKGAAIENHALVYLPYGYDAGKEHNILYLMHGGGDNEESWFKASTKNILDNAIASGYCDPLIVVTPTFNKNDVYTFGYELMNDLIPALETQYSTYAKGDISADNLKATRAHRAYAGLSMGSILSWMSILNYSTDYIGYVGSYSAGPDAGSDEVCRSLVDEVAANLKASGNKIYYWFNGNGTDDIAHDPHLFSYFYMIETHPELFVDGENSCWVDYIGGIHGFDWWELDLLNSLKVFFKANMPNGQTSQPSLDDTPKTGDNSLFAVYVVCALASLCGIFVLAAPIFKKRNDR